MKAVVLDSAAVSMAGNSWHYVKELVDEFEIYDRTSPDLVISRAQDAEIVLINKVIIDRNVLDSLPNLKFIGVQATGYNGVDTAYAREKGVIVSNIPSYSTDSVIQHTVALILEYTNRVGIHSASVAKGDWATSVDFCYLLSPLMELSNKTIAIVGYGAIGSGVERVMKALGMKTLIVSRHAQSDNVVTLEDAFAKADIMSLHCPQNASNYQMINRDTIKLMKDGALLVNTARGGLVDEKAIRAALDNGKLAGYLADVSAVEPQLSTNPLLNCEKVILTPHNAWLTREAHIRLVNILIDNIKGFLEGMPINVVN